MPLPADTDWALAGTGFFMEAARAGAFQSRDSSAVARRMSNRNISRPGNTKRAGARDKRDMRQTPMKCAIRELQTPLEGCRSPRRGTVVLENSFAVGNRRTRVEN